MAPKAIAAPTVNRKHLGDLLLGHVDLGRQLGERRRAVQLELQPPPRSLHLEQQVPARVGRRIMRPLLVTRA